MDGWTDWPLCLHASKVRNKASESPPALPFDSIRPPSYRLEWLLLPTPSPGSPRAWGWGLLMAGARPQAQVWPWQGVVRAGKASSGLSEEGPRGEMRSLGGRAWKSCEGRSGEALGKSRGS